jgi:hypothetical protein
MASNLKLSDTERDGRFDDDDIDSDYSHEREYEDDDGDDDEDDSQDVSGRGTQEVERGTSSDNETVVLRKELDTLRRRFSGASRRINEEIQSRTQLENRYQQERAQLMEAVVRERIQDLPPGEQHAKLDEFRRLLHEEQNNNQHQSEKAMMAEVARRAYIIELSQQTGVPAEELENIKDGDTMEWFAQRESSRAKKQTQTQKRNRSRSKGNQDDRVEHTSSPPKPPKTVDEGENAFLAAVRRRR